MYTKAAINEKERETNDSEQSVLKIEDQNTIRGLLDNHNCYHKTGVSHPQVSNKHPNGDTASIPNSHDYIPINGRSTTNHSPLELTGC